MARAGAAGAVERRAQGGRVFTELHPDDRDGEEAVDLRVHGARCG
jgi:hypothetical protein